MTVVHADTIPILPKRLSVETIVDSTPTPLKLSRTNPEADSKLGVLANIVTVAASGVSPTNVASGKSDGVFIVPFFSQLTDITNASWKGVGCGITGLAMLIEYYYPGEMASVDTLLDEGIAAGAYINNVGWSYRGLITVAEQYGLTGSTHDYKNSPMDEALAALQNDLNNGPVMASVHYTFTATNPIPHLVIINGIQDNIVYYNDPAGTEGGGTISLERFKNSWKKRYIEFHPIG